jgi:hypothetical protein
MQRYSMTPVQIDLVRKSFDALWLFRRKLAEHFLRFLSRRGEEISNGRQEYHYRPCD